jgi:hypothetical protein
MKKQALIIALIMTVISINGQNIQFLKGKDVNFITTEIFKPLEHGRFYYFTDFKMDKDGYFDSYTEISEYWNINSKGLSVTAQYNAGIFALEDNVIRVKPVYLFGLSKEGIIKTVNLTFDVLYRIDMGTNLDNKRIGNGIQLTGTFLKDTEHFQISGYCDLWQTKNSKYYNKNRNPLIVQFEPQAWWKFSKRIYAGAEARLSNFNDTDLGLQEYSNYIMIGIKWSLE